MTNQEKINCASHQPSDEVLWQRQMIEKMLLQKKRRARKWWIVLIVLSSFAIWTAFSSTDEEKDSHKDHIATLSLDTEISDDNDTLNQLATSLKDIYAKQKHLKAVLIKANSPGGSPVISDIAYQEIKHYKQKYPDIPIYTVVSDICASGCYYIASATDKIFANRSSMVGSIGVIMTGIDLRGLADKLGIKDRTRTAGINKALGNPLQAETPEQVQILHQMLDDIHGEFINAVKKGRGQRLQWQNNPDIFSGRIYTGVKGKQVGLIDDFGNIYSVARNIMQDPVLIDYTPKEDWWFDHIKKITTIGVKSLLMEFSKSANTFFQ